MKQKIKYCYLKFVVKILSLDINMPEILSDYDIIVESQNSTKQVTTSICKHKIKENHLIRCTDKKTNTKMYTLVHILSDGSSESKDEV